MPSKIAMIGAGSVVFCKTLMSDIMATPALSDSRFALMSPTESKLRRMEAFAGRMIRENALSAEAWATTDRREAIRDADFVVVMIQVGESGAYYKYTRALAGKYARHDPLEFESPKIEGRSVEYCSYIMESVVTGHPFRFMGNVRNDGYITNLPAGCCVEVPASADASGVHPSTIGELPPQCAAACITNVNVQVLAGSAALSGDPETIVHAVAMDPLTGAVCTLKEIRDMCREMLEAERKWLPQFEGKGIRPTPTIYIPPDCQPAAVPLDPALAINKRFATLIEQKTD